MVKTVKFEDRAEVGPKACLLRQSEQNIWNKINKFSKFGQTKKVWYLFLRVLLIAIAGSNLRKVHSSVSTQIWDSSNISKSHKILSFNMIGKSWDKSYTKFIIVDIKFRFTCGESDPY